MKKNTNPQHIYHLFPLGALRLDQSQIPNPSTPYAPLRSLEAWIPHLRSLQVDCLMLGPVFESESHGYETINYDRVDPRLGDWSDLVHLVQKCHESKIKVVLDAVWNHTSTKHEAYKNWVQSGRQSGWYTGKGWNGHDHLPALNHQLPEVRQFILDTATLWIEQLGIDGVRIDAADSIERGFLREIARHCHSIKSDFWIMGEVIHGDYRLWLNDAELDSVTHYEGYKSLWSSFNDKNFFEMAYSNKRLFDDQTGIYQGEKLMLFSENHDVNRVASILKNSAHLYPLYLLNYCLPGIPSIYYGGEWGMTGVKDPQHDWPLRPAMPMPLMPTSTMENPLQPDLIHVIQHLAYLRVTHQALYNGGYKEILVANEQLAFVRTHNQGSLLVAVNSAPQAITLKLPVAGFFQGTLHNVLDPHLPDVVVENGFVTVNLPACWGGVFI